jgi:uncharacterized membrane protein
MFKPNVNANASEWSSWKYLQNKVAKSEDLLRCSEPRSGASISFRSVVAIVVLAGLVYGAAMGSYAAVALERSWGQQWLQSLYSGVKVPLLLAATLVISLPSFFVINTLLGLRDDFQESLKAIVSAQAGLTMILLSFMPLTLFVYVSVSPMGNGYALAILFNAITFGVSSIAAQILLRKYYDRLIQKNSRHRLMVKLWILVYAIVGIQVAYLLRPFIGGPNQSIEFFRENPFENAYVKVIEIIWSAARSR